MTIFSGSSISRNKTFFVQAYGLTKPYFRHLTVGFLLLIFTVAIQLSYPKAIAFFIDNSVAQKEITWLAWAAIIITIVLLLQAVANAFRFYIFSATGSKIVTNLRQSLHDAIIRQEIGFFDASKVGDLTNRLSADVEELQDTLSLNLAIFLRALFTCIGGSVMLIILSPILSLLMLVVVPPTLLLTRWLGKQAKEKSKANQDKLAECSQTAMEAFSNIRLVHAFTQEKRERKKYTQATGKALEVSLALTRLFAGFQGSWTFIQGFVLVVILWFGAKLIADQSLTIGGLTSFVLYTGMVATSASSLTHTWGEWMRSVGATERVFELLNRVPQTRPGSGIPIPELKGNVEFQNVTFSYPTRPGQKVLKSFNLRIKAGEKVALVGPSGAGKSTVVNLLLGFYTPSSGHLKFDGMDSETLSLDDIRKNIAIVEQEPALFSETIIENIRYAVPDTYIRKKDVIEAAKHANAHDFICRFPKGYNTLVGNRGVQLSGGQKQRIAIARALLRDPKILILDEATSALDSESENQVQSALKHLMKGRTTIMIAHRFSTIAHADRLIVLKDGEIIQNDIHDKLILDSKGLYYQLMKEQIGNRI